VPKAKYDQVIKISEKLSTQPTFPDKWPSRGDSCGGKAPPLFCINLFYRLSYSIANNYSNTDLPVLGTRRYRQPYSYQHLLPSPSEKQQQNLVHFASKYGTIFSRMSSRHQRAKVRNIYVWKEMHGACVCLYYSCHLGKQRSIL